MIPNISTHEIEAAGGEVVGICKYLSCKIFYNYVETFSSHQEALSHDWESEYGELAIGEGIQIPLYTI